MDRWRSMGTVGWAVLMLCGIGLEEVTAQKTRPGVDRLEQGRGKPVQECPADAAAEWENPLPRYLTEAEQRFLQFNPPPPPEYNVVPPTGPVHCPAEYEPMQGILMAWEGNESWKLILAQMARHITTTGDADVYVMCDDTVDRDHALTRMSEAGADMNRVGMYILPTDSIWIRDYGPRYIYEGRCRAIVDHRYNRPRPRDDEQPFFWSEAWSQALYRIPLRHGGGNFHLDALGSSFVTRLVNEENSDKTEQEIHRLWQEYENLDTTFFDPFDRMVDATQHIDMWMQVIADDAVVISDWPFDAESPQDRICDDAAAHLSDRGYRVFRAPARHVGGVHYTYTNVVMCNGVVIIPSYTNNSVRQHNDQALAVYQSALPDKAIVQVDAQAIVTSAGVLHCIVMHMPAPPGGRHPTVYLKNLRGGELLSPGDVLDIVWISDDDNAVTRVDILLSTDAGETFPKFIAKNAPPIGSFAWTVPDMSADQARLRVVVYDDDGHSGMDQSDSDILICKEEGCHCTGDERIKKARCIFRTAGSFRLKVIVADGRRGDTFEVVLSRGDSYSGLLDERGKGKAKFENLLPGAGQATVTWGCGTQAVRNYACP